MRKYSINLEEFEKKFSIKEAYRDYLFKLSWANGFQCLKCGNATAWPTGIVLFECSKFNHQTSVTQEAIAISPVPYNEIVKH